MKIQLKIFIISFLLFILIVACLPYFTADGYSVLRNTTSELGSQKTPNAWVMNFGFAIMGISSIIGGWKHYKGYIFHRVVLFVFGFSLVMVAVFHHYPIEKTNYDVNEDKLHSLFASLTGFSFTLLAAATGITNTPGRNRIAAFIVALIASGLSGLMAIDDHWTGIWQRMIFAVSFGWMIFEFRNTERNNKYVKQRQYT